MGSDKRRNGVIGTTLLSSLRVTFDYQHRRMYLEGPTEQLGSNGPLGVHIANRAGQWKVVRTTTELIGNVDLRKDDLIIDVNGHPHPKNPSTLYQQVIEHGRVELAIRRGKEEKKIVLLRPARLPIVRPIKK